MSARVGYMVTSLALDGWSTLYAGGPPAPTRRGHHESQACHEAHPTHHAAHIALRPAHHVRHEVRAISTRKHPKNER